MRLIKFHTIESNTFASRNGTIIDGLVVHTTNTGGLKRITTIRNDNDKKFFEKIAKRALDLPGINIDLYKSFLKEYLVQDAEIPDALRLCLQAAGLERSASWHYCVASKKTSATKDQIKNGVLRTKDIDVIEFVPPEFQAHHVGDLGKPTNRRSIGIENMYPPALLKGQYSENEAVAYFENIGWPKPYLAKGPDKAKYWYTPIDQDALDALEDLCVELVLKFKDIYWIGSHTQFCSDRIDPDPPIDLALLRKNVSTRTNRELIEKPKGSPKIRK